MWEGSPKVQITGEHQKTELRRAKALKDDALPDRCKINIIFRKVKNINTKKLIMFSGKEGALKKSL
jgi:hypothetical protein